MHIHPSTHRGVALGVVLLFLFGSVVTAQEPPELSLKWINGPEAALVELLPHHEWLSDGSSLWTGPKLPGDGVPQRLDPATGEFKPLFDGRKMFEAARAAGVDGGFDLSSPEAFDRSGRRGLFIVLDDIWLADYAANLVMRITKTEEAEKAVRFSPDGERIAFVRSNDLWVYDIGSKSEVRLTADGSETTLNGTVSWVYWEEIFGRQDIGYWWSPDSKALAYLRTDESKVTLMTYQHFVPAIPKLLTQRYPKAGTANPEVKIGVVEIGENASTQWIDFGGKSYEYVVRAKWLPDARSVSVATMDRSQRNLDLWFADRSSGKARLILSESDEGWVNINDDLTFLRDGKHFLWVSERSGYAHLYRYDMEGKLVNAVTKGEFALRDAGGVFWLRQAVKGVDEEKGLVYVTALEKSSIEAHLYRVGLDGEGWTRISDKDGKHAVSMSPDGKWYIDDFSAIDRAPSSSLHAADGSLVKEVTTPYMRPLERFGVVYPELMKVPARDGFEMPAWIMKPRNFNPENKYPVILYTYGGPSAPSVAHAWDSWLLYNQFLLNAGFCVACVDNRSATAISKKLENTAAGEMYGDGELNDMVDAAQWFKKQPWVDAGRIGIWGWSGGGMMTILCMTRSQEFKAGIAVAALTKWEYYDTFWAEQSMKRPEDNRGGYRKTDLVRRAKDLHGRILLVHGTYDDNVHIQNCYHFADALIAAGKLFEVMIYPMRQHGISDPPAFMHLQATMLDFWKRHL